MKKKRTNPEIKSLYNRLTNGQNVKPVYRKMSDRIIDLQKQNQLLQDEIDCNSDVVHKLHMKIKDLEKRADFAETVARTFMDLTKDFPSKTIGV